LRHIAIRRRGGRTVQTPLSFEELIGKSVHISLMHIFYDGRLAAQYELYGQVIRIDDDAVVVRLADSQEECRLRRDVRVFKKANGDKSKDADFHVSVGSVGIAYRNDLTRCLYT
jgi:hypothetical protein